AYLLDRAAQDPGTDAKSLKDRYEPLMRLRDDDSSARPAEAQYLAMYWHLGTLSESDLVAAPQPPPEHLKTALATRRSAERSAWNVHPDHPRPPELRHAYSEQVYRWIADRVQEADRERGKGQDLLFLGDEKSWKDARAFLDKAAALYAAIDKDALEISR